MKNYVCVAACCQDSIRQESCLLIMRICSSKFVNYSTLVHIFSVTRYFFWKSREYVLNRISPAYIQYSRLWMIGRASGSECTLHDFAYLYLYKFCKTKILVKPKGLMTKVVDQIIQIVLSQFSYGRALKQKVKSSDQKIKKYIIS